MTPFTTRIVAATDFSADAELAVKRAAMLASEHGVPLELLHVVPRTAMAELRWAGTSARLVQGFRRVAHEDLEALAASIASPVQVSTRVEMGDVVRRIAQLADEDTLVVVGARGQSSLRDLLLGSTAERLLGRARGAVLVVKSAPRGPYRNVIAALDLQDGSGSVLDAALRVARSASVTATHAYDVPFEGTLYRAGIERDVVERHRGDALRLALARLDAIVDRAGDGDHRVVTFADRDHPAKVLLQRAAARDADLIVLGRRPRSVAERLLVGSVARHVVAGSDRDALIVPQAPEARTEAA